MYLLLASVLIISVVYIAYVKGTKGALEGMGAIAIIDHESNGALFASSEAKQSFSHYLDKLTPTLHEKLISDFIHVPYRFRGKQCRLFYLSSSNVTHPHNSLDIGLLHTLIQSTPDAIGVTDHEMRYQACNQAFVEPLGIENPEDLLGKKLEDVASPEIADKFALSDKRVLETGEEFLIIDEVEGLDGQTQWIDARKIRYTHPCTKKSGLFILGRDITEVERVKKELNTARDNYKKLSMVDALTKISNRRMFDEHLQIEWGNHTRSGKPMSIIMCDIDEFKKLNDVYGHIQGDKVLSIVARSLADLVTDPSYSVFRYGGEEFAFILSETDEEQVKHFAERVHTAIASIFVKHGISNVEGELTVSLGVYTCYPINHGHSMEAIQMVDEALYQAKSRGRNRTVYVEFENSAHAAS